MSSQFGLACPSERGEGRSGGGRREEPRGRGFLSCSFKNKTRRRLDSCSLNLYNKGLDGETLWTP